MAGKKRILIVDDEAAIANSLAAVFSTQGYDAKAAYSAEQAELISSEWTPDLAIVDVRLGQADGVSFAVAFRETFPACEVALFTGLTDLTQLLEKARAAGHNFEVVSKPIHPEDILRFVGEKLFDLGDADFSLA